MTELEGMLLKTGAEIGRDVPLADISSFRIGGKADLLICPQTAESLVSVIRALRGLGISFEVLGNTSNVLFEDEGYRGAILLTKRMSEMSIEGERIRCGAGAMLPLLARRAADASLSGLEFACGIPATLGGAVAMNAGAHGGEMSDLLVFCSVYDMEKDEVTTLSAEECRLGYRHSIFSENGALICLGAELELARGNASEIKEKMKEYSEKRRFSQPLDKPSAGSFFKRPEGYFAAKLIDECGLKGYRVGGACVSEKHAGFIVNLGGATSADVLAVADKVAQTVLEATGIKLEREVRVIRSPEK